MTKSTKIFMILLGIFLCFFTPISDLLTGETLETVNAAEKPVLNYNKKSILKGEKFTLELKNGERLTSFRSTSKSIATVSSKGVITGKRAGSATITAKAAGRTLKCRVTVRDKVDLIVFAGQSNMTGRGDTEYTPALIDGAGYECPTVTNPRELLKLTEPFGMGQDSGNLYDADLRKGSMVTAFVNTYYQKTRTPVIAISATQTGSGCVSWGHTRCVDVVKRIKIAKKTLRKKGLKIDNCYLVFMQGENDGLAGTDSDFYKENLKSMMKYIMKRSDVEQCMLIRIGKYTGNYSAYRKILKAQTQLCKTDKRFALVSVRAASLPDTYYQNDGIHLNQWGLNLIGKEAGRNAAYYKRNKKEVSLSDSYFHNTYKAKR